MGVMMEAQDEDAYVSLAGRLSRLDRQMTSQERDGLRQLTNGAGPGDMAKALLNAYDPDVICEQAQRQHQLPPDVEPEPPQIQAAQQSLLREAASLFTGEVVDYVENIRKVHEQIIDTVNIDQVTYAGWDAQAQKQSSTLVQDFAQFIESNKDEITALRIFYNLPYQRHTVTLPMIREVLDILQAQKPQLAPARVWQAYARLDNVQPANPISELTTLMALIRRVVGLDERLTPYASTVDRNFQSWFLVSRPGR